MTLPVDLVFVRHGESEGNLAKKLREAGQKGIFDSVHSNRHTRSFRLTDNGRMQATAAGNWIRNEFRRFDRYITSEYVRAIETSLLLDMTDALWDRPSIFLIERDWGELDQCSEDEREKRFGNALRLRDVEPFLWRPLNGESLAELCVRLTNVLDTLHRESSDQRVLIVCHGEVMWGFRVLLERMSQQLFRELHHSEDPTHKIRNCQVVHYSRRNPVTGELSTHADWVRMIRPTEKPVSISAWQTIDRTKYTNDDLREIVDLYPPVLR